MKDYLTIHINKNTLKFITKILFLAFIIFGIYSIGSWGYNSIKDSGYDEGYIQGKRDVMNYTINAIREDGYGFVELDNDHEYFYNYTDPCDPKPEYCDWELDFNNNIITWGTTW